MPIRKYENFILPAMSEEALDNLPFGIYIISQEGIIEFFNTKMTEISGVEDAGVIEGQNVFDIPNYKQYGLLKYIRQGLGGKPFKIEGIKYVSFVGKKESYRSYYGIPVKDEKGRVQKLLCICEDVTRQKKLEERVATDLAEKEVLLKEINHRVKNNMQVVYSLINLQSLNIKDKSALRLLEESKSQIKSMLLVHEKLYSSKNILKIDINDYIRDLADNIFKLFWVDEKRISRKILVDRGLVLSLDKAIPCALIINELITNALKYAFPGKGKGEITIGFRKTRDHKHELSVGDNGVGFAAQAGEKPAKTLGLELVRTLTRQINGEMEIANDHGVKITIKF
jgi:PAS domain S-box-containing protein